MMWIVIVLLILTSLWFASGAVLAYFGSNRKGNMDKLLGENKASGDIPRRIEMLRRQTPGRISQEYEIVNREGIRLHGYLIRSRQPSDVYVFYSHGYRSPDGAMEFGPLLPMWEGHDFNFFLVDHRGHGKSSGSHISFGLYESEDNMEWLDFMIKTFGKEIQIILEGQSMGAATVLMMSGKTLPKQVRFILADCGYTCYFDVACRSLRFPGSRLVLESGNLWLTLFHGINMKKAKPIDAVAHASVPILFTHGEKDPLVPVEMGKANYAACSSEKELVLFPDGEHTTAPVIHPEEYAACVNAFIERYLED